MIRATITPADATDATLNWSSSNESVATVDANGTVTAIAPGTVTITVTAVDGSGVTALCEIRVIAPAPVEIPVSSIEAEFDSEMTVGDVQTVTATVLPADASNPALNWISSNESVATVTDGVITALGEGRTVITIASTDGSGVTAQCEITVSDNAAIGDVDAAEATVRAIGGEIVVEGAPVGTVVRIFAVDGMELYRSVSTGEAIVFAPGVRGVCLVAVGNRCVKISL